MDRWCSGAERLPLRDARDAARRALRQDKRGPRVAPLSRLDAHSTCRVRVFPGRIDARPRAAE
jgi:hypothetical protein